MSKTGEYFSDVENAGEMVRLLKQARVVTQALGGPCLRRWISPRLARPSTSPAVLENGCLASHTSLHKRR